MKSIWRNKKVLTVLVDIVISGATLAVGKWVAPDMQDIALWAVGAFQALTAVLIVEFAIQEHREMLAQVSRDIQATMRELRR